MNYTIRTYFEIDNGMFADVIDSAGYGIGYWAHSGHHDKHSETYTVTWDGEGFEDDSEFATGTKTLTYWMIGEAIEALHTRTYQVRNDLHTQLNEWLMGEPTMDIDLADVIIQIALFGKLIYG